MGDCFDFAEIRPSKNVTSGRVTHPAAATAAASFALLLRNFGGISVSFVLPDNDASGAATQSEGRNPLAPNARRVSASLGMILYKYG